MPCRLVRLHLAELNLAFCVGLFQNDYCMLQLVYSIHRRRSGWNSGGTHGEGRRWIGAELGRVWGGVSPLQLTRGSGGAL